VSSQVVTAAAIGLAIGLALGMLSNITSYLRQINRNLAEIRDQLARKGGAS